MDNKPLQLFAFSDALLVGTATCYAYALAFVYEWGWLSYHHLPTYLIEVSLSQVFVTVAALIGLVFAGLIIFMFIPFGIKNYLAGLGAVLMVLLSGAAVVAAFGRRPLQHWAILFSILVFVAFFALLTAVVRSNRKEGLRWWQWLRTPYEPNYLPTKPDEHTLYTTFLQHLADRGVNIFYVSTAIVVSLHLLNVTYKTGRSDARSPGRFLVSRKDSATTLLRVIGDRAVLNYQTMQDSIVLDHYRIVPTAALAEYDWLIMETRPTPVTPSEP